MASAATLALAISTAFLDGSWTSASMCERAQRAVRGVRTETRVGAWIRIPHGAIPARRWLPRLARACLARFPEPPHAELDRLIAFVRARPELRRHAAGTEVRVIALPAPRMRTVRGPLADLPLPAITTLEELAALAHTSVEALDFLSRPRHGSRCHPRYATRWIPKRSGGVRVLEVPSPPLRRLQRTMLDAILAHVPTHPSAHGFVRGRSPRSGAVGHVGREVVVRLDLADFFASVTAPRVRGVFEALGYPDLVARRLTAIATTRLEARALARLRALPAASDDARARRHLLAQRLRAPHLPQGAPSSPALANLVAFHLDARLAGLARQLGATYTRYADDLTFSGDARLAHRVEALVSLAARICRDEGFALRDDKTRIARRHVRQEVLGVVVNERPNLARDRYDRLRAVLHRVAREGYERAELDGTPLGPSALAGHVAHACTLLGPRRAAKLRAMWSVVVEREDARSA
jgi:hypothetical protein